MHITRTIRATLVTASLLTLPGASGAGAQGVPRDPAAPREFTVDFETSAGRFALHVERSWAPLGADRLFALVTKGFYDGTRFHRVVPGFGVQFGISRDPRVSRIWRLARLGVDRVRRSNKAMFVAFAAGMGPDTRTTQLFINLADNPALDREGFAPVGWITDGQDVVKRLYSGYWGHGAHEDEPEQWRMQTEGLAYLLREYPRLDYVVTATIRSPASSHD